MTAAIMQTAAAFIGTIAFALLFGVPRRFYLGCGMVGGIGWAAYLIAAVWCSSAVSCLIATMTVVLLSRFAAIAKRCPVTIFLIAGIIPLVPGAGVYWTAYYLVTDQPEIAMSTGYQALKNAAAIVLGIVFVFEIPQRFFLRVLKREKM